MLTKAFALATLERAVKTFAQSLIGALAVASSLTDAPWGAALSAAGLATVVSVLTSIVSSGVGGNGPSLGTETLTPEVAAKQADAPELVAGPAADVPEGTPVDVVPADSVQSLVNDALNQPYPPKRAEPGQ